MNDLVNVSIRISPALKKQCDEIFQRLGMNTIKGIRLFLWQMTLYQCIPFHLTLENKSLMEYNQKKTVSVIFKIDREIKNKCTELAGYAGLNLSVVIMLYLVQVVDKNGIPFPVRVNERV